MVKGGNCGGQVPGVTSFSIVDNRCRVYVVVRIAGNNNRGLRSYTAIPDYSYGLMDR